jgi:hypothetical protein
VSKNGVEFPVRIDLGGAAGPVDYLREAAPGRWAGAYLRVSPQPRVGSIIVMTLPTQVGGTAAATAAILRTELAAIVSSVGDTGIYELPGCVDSARRSPASRTSRSRQDRGQRPS